MALSDLIVGAESGGNPTARNPRSSAYGAGQFIDSTWLSMLAKYRPDLAGLPRDQQLALRADPTLSKTMTDAYAQENGQKLAAAGFDPNPGNTYLAHFAGPAGALKVLQANPSASAASVLGPQAAQANPFMANMTAGELQAWAHRKMGTPIPPAPIPLQSAPQFPSGAMAQAPQAVGGGPMPLFAPQQPPRTNLDAAHAALNLTPQERALYERHLTNLYGPGGVDNPNGSRSTLYQLSFDNGGRTYNVPTVYDGKILPPEEAIQRARSQGLDQFPSYGSSDEAEARYQKMHDFMERDTGAYMQQRQAPQTQPTQQAAGGPLDLMALMGKGGMQPQSLPPLFAPQSQQPQMPEAQPAPQSFFASLPAGPQQMAGNDLANWWARMNPTG